MTRYHFIREERYFCSLLMFAIIKEPRVARDIFDIELGDRFEIYNETSILRDYWDSLGDASEGYKDATNEKRSNYLRRLCAILDMDFGLLQGQGCFSSSKGYVNSPARYRDSEITDARIKTLRALFNMRQDLLLVDGDTLHFVEAKLESPNLGEQIGNFVLLERLLDRVTNSWGAIEKFNGIRNNRFYYIKKTRRALGVPREIRDKLMEVPWSRVFAAIVPVLSGVRGIALNDADILKSFPPSLV